MSDPVNTRKREHLEVIARDPDTDRRKHYFDAIRLQHRALPELDLAAIDPGITFMNRRLSLPLLISSMTGGDDDEIRTINRNLAIAAEATGVAMGVGSQRVMFSHPAARASFDLRRHAPTTLLFANLGAVGFNYGLTIQQCREAVEVLAADGLFLHLNPLQEAAQPEGDTDFSGLAGAIARVAAALPCPVLVKEVGCGLARADAELLIAAGIRYLDVAGAGGTSWSRIEYHRHHDAGDCSVGRLFQDWGIPTPVALRALAPCRDCVTLIASGGIRSGLDMAKAMVLGASLCGLARPFLEPARNSPEAVIATIRSLERQFTTALFLLGIPSAEALIGNAALLQDTTGALS